MCVVKQEELCFVTGLLSNHHNFGSIATKPSSSPLIAAAATTEYKNLPQPINQFYPYITHCQQVSNLEKTDSYFSQNQFSDCLQDH